VYCCVMRPRVVAAEDMPPQPGSATPNVAATPTPQAALETSATPVSPPLMLTDPYTGAPPTPADDATSVVSSDPYMVTPSLPPPKAACLSPSETNMASMQSQQGVYAKPPPHALVPRSKLQGRMWPFNENSDDDAPVVCRTPSPARTAFYPPPEFLETGAHSSPTPPPALEPAFPLVHAGRSPTPPPALEPRPNRPHPPKRARMGNQSLPHPKRRGQASSSSNELLMRATAASASSQAPDNQDHSTAASASAQVPDTQHPVVGVQWGPNAQAVFAIGCQCADCVNGEAPRTHASTPSQEYAMLMHEEHCRRMRLRYLNMWHTEGRNAVRAAASPLILPVTQPVPNIHPRNAVRAATLPVPTPVQLHPARTLPATLHVTNRDGTYPPVDQVRAFSLSRTHLSGNLAPRFPAQDIRLRWGSPNYVPGLDHVREFTTWDVFTSEVPPTEPEASPEPAWPRMLQFRTLDDWMNDDAATTSQTEAAPWTVRSSSSSQSQGAICEPELEPDSLGDEAEPSISSPPDDIHLL
jgi:hypothetical protein